MRILLTNDDGYHAPGLAVLEEIAAELSDDVWIVAPSEEQSGTGRALTLTRPIRFHRHDERRYAVAGTPTDAVMAALAVIMREARPDLILSGVNRGGNLGEDVMYSGTVSAAMEGALAGIPAVALSQRYEEEEPGAPISFEAARAWGARVLRPIVAAEWAPRTMVNVNFPALGADEVRGVRVVRQGLRDYGRSKFTKRTDPRGNDHYWLGLARVPHTPLADTDLEAVGEGYVSVTPLHLDLTHERGLDALAAAYS